MLNTLRIFTNVINWLLKFVKIRNFLTFLKFVKCAFSIYNLGICICASQYTKGPIVSPVSIIMFETSFCMLAVRDVPFGSYSCYDFQFFHVRTQISGSDSVFSQCYVYNVLMQHIHNLSSYCLQFIRHTACHSRIWLVEHFEMLLSLSS